MQDYPHIYKVEASADAEGEVTTDSPGLDSIGVTSPPEFGGPEGYWSPETLLAASVADCLVLTFRAIARASKFEWHGLRCEVEGVLERVDRVTKFTRFNVKARLSVPEGSRLDRAEMLLHKAEKNCLITRSLSAETLLEVSIEEVPAG